MIEFEYSSEIKNVIPEKSKLFEKIFGKKLTVEIPLTYAPDVEMLKYLPSSITRYNVIEEDIKYFNINGNKVKKMSFLKQILVKDRFESVEVEASTTGKMLLTMDHEWFKKCSDPKYTSWESCFSPNGCNRHCPHEYATSPNILMALIVNSDESKMIGRRFVAIPFDDDSEEELASGIFFMRCYGTFPVHYQRSLSDFIISKLFESTKGEWKKAEGPEEMEDSVYVEAFESGGRWKRIRKPGINDKIWFDGCQHVFIDPEKYDTKSFNKIVFRNELDVFNYDQEDNDDQEDDYFECRICEEETQDRNCETVLQSWNNYIDICVDCFNENYIVERHGCYALRENCFAIAEFTSNSIVRDANMAVEGDPGIIDIYIEDRDETIYAVFENIPDCCMEVSGVWTMFEEDLENGNRTLITKLIEEESKSENA